MEESERDILQILALIAYQTITEQVIKEVQTRNSETDGHSEKMPHWAWWKDDGSVDDTNIPKWCLFKFVPANQTSKQGNAQTNTLVMASTVACAAASGRSRGFVDRAGLAAAVLDSLKLLMADLQSAHSKLELSELLFNDKSGQIQVIFTMPPNYLMQVSLSRSSSCCVSEMEEHKPTTIKTKVPLDDPFTEFLLRYQSDRCPSRPNDRFSHLKESSMSTVDSSQQQLFLVVRTVPVLESSIQPEVHQLFCRYQSSIHGDDNPYLCSEDNTMAEDPSEEYMHYLRHKSAGFLNVDATYGHFNAVQRAKIKKSYLSFYRFLCETPLRHEALDSSGTHTKDNEFILKDGYDVNISRGGTYHQQYRLCTSKDSFDGPLIAVGVVDMLPSCLSSVYAFYDPRLSSKLELGKYTALREIEWVRRAKWLKQRYYYLGYYIHSCQKMIYKAEYKPSELLCPVNFKWIDFEVAKNRLEKKSPIRHCCALYEGESTDDERKQQGLRIESIVLDIGESGGAGEINLLNVGMLTREGRKMIDPLIREFVHEVGPDLARKLIVKLS
ncbi:hypothetical protein HJC23_013933 [Cyclotella cryptica]|uniref:N-end rule aminoacyl transferase C-terminal domain-containing protein n=1 Tax=Cyclotella cryptica TaxID=29204 RepID=A0ABD3NLI9_9STRA|eukprot:CCRYP_020486-RA/>CCRYP_020486-RA protein AED:0.03 eAED:0.03 QI:1586/1/1/1/0.75/0.4/5/2085/553